MFTMDGAGTGIPPLVQDVVARQWFVDWIGGLDKDDYIDKIDVQCSGAVHGMPDHPLSAL